MIMYINRTIEKTIKMMANEFPVIVISGARQVGKTWLMKEFGKKYYKQVAYITFDTNETARQIFTKGFNIERIIITHIYSPFCMNSYDY